MAHTLSALLQGQTTEAAAVLEPLEDTLSPQQTEVPDTNSPESQELGSAWQTRWQSLARLDAHAAVAQLALQRKQWDAAERWLSDATTLSEGMLQPLSTRA